jgi:hypothetical protein
MSGLLKGGGATETTVQNKDPWGPAQPYLADIMKQANALYVGGAGGQTWGGPLQAGMSPDMTNSFNMMRGLAGQDTSQPFNYANSVIGAGGMAPGTSAGTGVLGSIAGQSGPTSAATNLGGMASGADAGNNPYLKTMLDDNAARIGNRVASQMSGAGRYGSFGHGDALARSITAANAPILSQAYENDQNRMLQANSQIDSSNRALDVTRSGAASGLIGALQGGQGQALQASAMMPELDAARYAGADRLAGIGQFGMGREQDLIDAQRALFNQQQQQPWTMLNRYLGGVSGLGGLLQGMGTTTGNKETEKNLGLLDYASLFSGGTTASGGSASPAQGGSAAADAFLKFLSDRNEKTDIKKLGKDPATGLPLYAYRYKGDSKTYPKTVGPMAQDVEKRWPGSTERVGGKLVVKSGVAHAIGMFGR